MSLRLVVVVVLPVFALGLSNSLEVRARHCVLEIQRQESACLN
jgi:hypothetical protein